MNPGFPTHTHGRPRTPWAVFCGGLTGEAWNPAAHHLVYLTEDEYKTQLEDPGILWKCPLCGCYAQWDDTNYEEMQTRL